LKNASATGIESEKSAMNVKLLVVVIVAFALQVGASATLIDCARSDANILALHELYCASMGPSWRCPLGNYTAARDWPSQAVYMNNILVAVVDPSTCLDTAIASGIVEWLNNFSTDPQWSMWWWNWYIFQPQYYDMPRKQGARIESPATLGRKCWAFAYLAQTWKELRPQIISTMDRAKINLTSLVLAYDDAVPMSIKLCDEVMANCFVNATYDPALRNGTCPDFIGQFFVGFSWENGNNNAVDSGLCPVGNCWRNDSVTYLFPRYDQTDEWRADVVFSVNTALNYIV
jgi:hypothetical protein